VVRQLHGRGPPICPPTRNEKVTMFDIDLDTLNGNDLDQFRKTGGRVLPGRHHVRLDGVGPASGSKGGTGDELSLVVLAGPCIGSEFKETVWQSDKPAGQKRRALFALAFGLIAMKAGKAVRVEGKEGFGDCIGAEAVVEVCDREYTKKDGSKGTATNVTFTGVWPVGSPEVRGVMKGKPGDVPVKRAVDKAEL
jgi:hypothetical protein